MRFLAINDLMERDAVSPNAETITRTIKEEMTKSGQSTADQRPLHMPPTWLGLRRLQQRYRVRVDN